MNALEEIKHTLQCNADGQRATNLRTFFKNSNNDIFLGVGAARIRIIAKDYLTISLDEILELMKSNVHDERSVAYAILCLKFKKGDEKQKGSVFNFYIAHTQYLRDWDAVDDTAPHIAGPYLLNRSKDILYQLVYSQRIWDRRIAIVTTLYFVRRGNLDDALRIAHILLHDTQDLIHKAVGWVLREVGKKDVSLLKKFLDQYHTVMPRTMVRYAIERFSVDERKKYVMKEKR